MRVAFVIGLSCVIACSSNGNGPPNVDTSADNLCDQIAAVACYDLYQCCPEGLIEQALEIQNPESQDQCESDLHKQCVRALVTFESSLAAKRVTFDASVMNACLKALLPPSNECATVDTTLPWTDACMMSPWTGNVADGGMCFYNFECAGVGSGTATCKASSPRTLSAGSRSSLPSTSTAPLRINAFSRSRDKVGIASASARSRRHPAWPGARRTSIV